MLWPVFLAPLLVLAPLALGGGAAQARTCEAGPVEPRISVQIRLPTVRHDLSLSGPEIARLGAGTDSRIEHDHSWVDGTVGLTTVRFFSDYSVGHVFDEVEGGLCVQVGTVTAVFGFSEMVVYIASEYGTGSCAYKEVLNHEHLHVLIFREELLNARRPFEDAIAYALRQETPFLAPDREAAIAQTRRILENGVRPVLARMWAQGDAKHALLDSEESYRRTERQCADW